MSESTFENSNPSDSKQFERKVWKVCSIVALFIVIIWLLKATFSVLLLILAGVLIALYFHGFSKWINKKTKLSPKLSMVVSVSVTILVLAALVYFSGARIQVQVKELTDTLPGTISDIKERLNGTVIGEKIIETTSGQEAAKKQTAFFENFFRSTFGVLGDVYVVIFLGIFFTIAPNIYIKGFMQLIPHKGRAKVRDVMEKIGTTLTKWMMGKILAMFVVFILTIIGLTILGIPMAFALAVIAGLLNFIPNFGPLIAMIPAVLVGLTQDTNTAIIVACLYILVQIIESSFITPVVQQKLIRIPPAMLIIAQLFMGILSGGWGLLVATPLVAIIMVILQETYIKEQERIALGRKEG